MKRAAGQIRKVRRNKGGDKDGGGSLDGTIEDQDNKPVRRKPTAEEAALTAKNYRLAKELSDLRVRHREENKNVSRLTMENMNLATRWREAINHIGILKKELALQKHKTAEAQALAERHRVMVGASPQSQGSPAQSLGQSPTNSLVEMAAARGAAGAFQDVAAEMDKMDRLIAAHQNTNKPSPPPIPRASSSFEETASSVGAASPSVVDVSNESLVESDGEEKKTQSMDQPVTPSPEKSDDEEFDDNEHGGGVNFFATFKEPHTMVHVDDPPIQLSPAASITPPESPPPSPPQQTSSAEDMEEEDMSQLQQTRSGSTSPLFPMTASPVLVRSKVFNESFPGDITSDIVSHPRSAERRPASDFKDIQEEDDNAIAASSSMGSTNAKGPPPPPLSGIAAFDASFATPFPDSFSPADESNRSDDIQPASPEQNADEYNPFFPSPTTNDQPTRPSASASNKGQAVAASSISPVSVSSTVSKGRRGQADNAPSPVFSGRPRTAVASGLFTSTTSITGNTVDTRRRPTPSFDNPANTSTPNQRIRGASNLASVDDGISSGIEARNGTTTQGSATRYQTPPHGNRSPESNIMGSDGPKRPEKTGAAAARARYEKALQPRGYPGNSRRFPRRSERDAEKGSSPVSAPSVSSADGKVVNNGIPVPVGPAKLIPSQTRVKERAASFTGRSTIAPLQDPKPRLSYRETSKWAPRPSPTDSVSSKPWDEEIGDIPMAASSSSMRSTAEAQVSGESTGPRTNGVSTFAGGGPSANTVRSNYARRLLERNRPWDKSSPKQETAPVPISVQQDDLPQSQSDSPESRFIAAGKSRRRVKQPISYAEPSLSSKLRQGDVFFPKEEPNTRTASNPVHL